MAAPLTKSMAASSHVMQRFWPLRRGQTIAGFAPTMAFTIVYLLAIVLVPLSAVFIRTSSMGWTQFVQAVASPRVLAAYRVSFVTAVAAAFINTAAGLLVAWVLARYSFPGKRLVDAAVDLPFALP